MEDTEKIINQIAEEESIEKLGAIHQALGGLNELLNKNGASTEKSTMAIQVVAGQIVALKNYMEEDSATTKSVKGTISLTNNSIDEMTERFAARIKSVTAEAEKANQNSLKEVQKQSKDLIDEVQNKMDEMFTNLSDGVKDAVALSSKNVQPVVLVSSQSVKGNGRLKGRDLYDAKTLSGGGSNVAASIDYTYLKNPVRYDNAGTEADGWELVSYTDGAETGRVIQDLTGAVVAGATITEPIVGPKTYNNNQLAVIGNSANQTFTAWNSIAVFVKSGNVDITVNGVTITKTEEQQTFAQKVDGLSVNDVTVTCDATGEAEVAYVTE